ncbi:hypothetical protein BJY04DRAFT_114577 [Aspergillus karnatakaensis]|uniref:uncharacterized protein n=1 Tax=Aspergillus karnatakaensis TaxID=1810916 RepID=UPI003CCD1B97
MSQSKTKTAYEKPTPCEYPGKQCKTCAAMLRDRTVTGIYQEYKLFNTKDNHTYYLTTDRSCDPTVFAEQDRKLIVVPFMKRIRETLDNRFKKGELSRKVFIRWQLVTLPKNPASNNDLFRLHIMLDFPKKQNMDEKYLQELLAHRYGIPGTWKVEQAKSDPMQSRLQFLKISQITDKVPPDVLDLDKLLA